jgi:hypothetical protein
MTAMKRSLLMLLVCSLLVWAADFKPAKLLEIRDASEVGANTVSNSPEGITGQATYVPAVLSRCKITLALDGISYSAIYPANNHLKIGDFNAGDFILARIEGSKLVIKTIDGKEMKSKIVHREPIETPATAKPVESAK